MYKVYDINPFFSKLIVAVSDEPSREIAKLNLAFPGLELDWEKDDAGAASYETSYKPKGYRSKRHTCVLVFDAGESSTDGSIEASLAAHEAVHVVNNVFNSAGQKYDKDNDELQAYLTGWVVECVFDVLKDYKKEQLLKKKK